MGGGALAAILTGSQIRNNTEQFQVMEDVLDPLKRYEYSPSDENPTKNRQNRYINFLLTSSSEDFTWIISYNMSLQMKNL